MRNHLKPLLSFSSFAVAFFLTSLSLSVENNNDEFADYKKAMDEKTESSERCQLFSEIAQKADHALKDAAYVRSLQICKDKKNLDWQRAVPSWLEKEKLLATFQNMTDDAEKADFALKYPSYFSSPDRIALFQKAMDERGLPRNKYLMYQEALQNLAPRFMKNPPIKDQFRIVKDYRSVRNFEKTRKLLNSIIKSPNATIEDKILAHKELFATNKLQKNQKKKLYMDSAKNWAQFLKKNQLTSPFLLQAYYDAQINWARVVWTESGAEKALKVLDPVEVHLKNKISLHDLYWLKARMYEELKSPPQAVAELEKSLNEKLIPWKDKEKILWTLAWSYFKTKDYTKSETYLQQMIDHKETTPFARFKYLYWKGEAQDRRNEKSAAQSTWKQLIEEDAFGYYNLLAHHQLGRPLRNINVPEFHGDALLNTQDERVFQALKSVNENELAVKLLSQMGVESSQIKTWPAHKVATLFQYYASLANYKYIFAVFNQLPYDLQKDVFLLVPRTLFPEVYPEQMAKATQKSGMEPELLYAIMRQESSFDPMARSPMDAFGLLQVLPEVAKRIAREIKVPYRNYEDLFDEETNLLICSHLLKKQIQMFDNKFVLYVASYNASSSAVRNWYQRGQQAEMDDIMFIEEIPYEETKAYVKLVLRNYILYKKLKYGDSFKDFPREMLETSS